MTPLIVAVRFRKQAWCGCFVAFAILPKNLIDRALCLRGAALRDGTRRSLADAKKSGLQSYT